MQKGGGWELGCGANMENDHFVSYSPLTLNGVGHH